MRSFKKIPASKLGVGASILKGLEANGILFTPPNEHDPSEVVGAQCANCNSIIWLAGRDDPILNESKPNEVPQSGEGYKAYYNDKIKRFLASLPACPVCGSHNYDSFITNINIPRFQNGRVYDSTLDLGVNEKASERYKDIPVWWYA